MGFIDHSQLLSTAKRKALHPQASMSSPDERRPSTFLRLTPDAPVTTDRRPSTFLNLAPDTSNSYPRLPAHRDSVASSTVSNEEPAIQVPRRKSSPGVPVGAGFRGRIPSSEIYMHAGRRL